MFNFISKIYTSRVGGIILRILLVEIFILIFERLTNRNIPDLLDLLKFYKGKEVN